jgi:hypothetical protein
MDRRYSARMPVAMDVLFYRNGLPIMCSTLSNISAGGALTEAKNKIFHLGEIVDLELRFRKFTRTRSFRVTARVIRISSSALALAFEQHNSEIVRIFVHYPQPAQWDSLQGKALHLSKLPSPYRPQDEDIDVPASARTI